MAANGDAGMPDLAALRENREIFLPDGTMNPDHPMLAGLQAKLKQQLTEEKMRLEGELREKKNALGVWWNGLARCSQAQSTCPTCIAPKRPARQRSGHSCYAAAPLASSVFGSTCRSVLLHRRPQPACS